MEQGVFEQFKALVYRESGIVLNQDKIALLANRIQKRLRMLGVSDPAHYLEIIESDVSGEELRLLVEAVSTNTTYFYREPQHFPVLAQVLRQLAGEGKKEIKVWCAAASSGEEPYTLALTVLDALGAKSSQAKILASDINLKVLARADQGIYDESALRNVPPQLRSKYFRAEGDPQEQRFRVTAELRSLVVFKKLNLVEFPYPLRGPIDVIFCRNVMIYFDTVTRQGLVNEFMRLLSPGGYLFLSLSESLLGIQHNLMRVSNSVFRKPS